MKKRTNKLFAAALALLLALCLGGCGDSFESAMARAAKEMASVESVHAGMFIDMGFNLEIAGESAALDFTIDMEMDTDGSLSSGTMDISMLELPVSVMFVAENHGETSDLYLSYDGGETWDSLTGLSAAEAAENLEMNSDVMGTLGFFLEFASSFSEPMEGENSLRYDGFFPGDRLLEALYMTGGGDLAEVPEGTELPDAPISIWIDAESGLPVRVYLDMTDALGQYMTLSLAGGELADGVLSVSRVTVTMDMSRFNAADPMRPPEI